MRAGVRASVLREPFGEMPTWHPARQSTKKKKKKKSIPHALTLYMVY